MQRRAFLLQTGSALSLTFASGNGIWAQSAGADPFTLGVASGDPLPDSVVLWTRLARDPLHGGGMPRQNIEVEWQVASDDSMRQVVRRGKTLASPDLGHSVHVDVRGLEPGRWYWYQFKAGTELSPIGRTRTAAAANRPLERLRFAFASCQHYEQGYFNAYQHMAEQELDLVIHLGDYIYEGPAMPQRVRRHNSAEIVSLDDYRNRYALYRSDPHLRRAHAMFPWIVTWDDHEVDNNYAGASPEDGQTREQFLERRANAYQAYYEHMPLRRTSLPRGSSLQLYRRFAFGDLAEFSVLDTRQYRTDQPCGDGNKALCPAALSPNGVMLGAEQEAWLTAGLTRSRSRWNVLAQQVMMARVDRMAGPGAIYAMDQWGGYEVARNRLLGFLHERKIPNPVVLTGDIHSHWVADLKTDFSDEKSPVVGTEFVGTSITSGGDGGESNPAVEAYLPENPHVKYYSNQRGYVSCTVTPARWHADYIVVPAVSRENVTARTARTFVVESGKPGAQRG
jgi:alkaline phosphatase D